MLYLNIKQFHCFMVFVVLLLCSVQGRAVPLVSDYFPKGGQRDLAREAAAGHVDAIDRLLASGVNVNFQGKDGMTALMWAFMNTNKTGYEHLLDKGADPNLQMTVSSDTVVNGASAMSWSAQFEDPWYLQVTLAHGGNPNLKNPGTLATPIMECITLLDNRRPRPRLEQLRMLISAGAKFTDRDRLGAPPIVKAAMANRYDMVYIMMEAGADPLFPAAGGFTLLSVMRTVRVPPESPLRPWRDKVRDILRSRGVDVDHGR